MNPLLFPGVPCTRFAGRSSFCSLQLLYFQRVANYWSDNALILSVLQTAPGYTPKANLRRKSSLLACTGTGKVGTSGPLQHWAQSATIPSQGAMCSETCAPASVSKPVERDTG